MKKSNKSIIVLILLLILQFTFTTFASANDEKNHLQKYKTVDNSKEAQYRDAFISLLQPYIDKSINDYYLKYLNSAPQIDAWDVKVLSFERSIDNPFFFIIKVEVSPYFGAHNTVGIDQITFNINPGEVKLEKFEHIKSYEIQPNYQIEIKTWPPNKWD